MMANALDMLTNIPARVLIVGFPGSGKTGSIAALLNAGFKVRYLMYDKVSNLQPLFAFTNPDKLGNLDVALLEDKMRPGPQFQEPVGVPTAFNDGLKMLISWKYTKPDGTVVDLGSSKDWGSDTVVVLDSLTAMGEASMRRAQKFMNKTPANTTDRVWGFAMQEQLAYIQALCSSSNRHHTIVMSHLKMIGPKEIRNDDSDLTKQIKEQAAPLIPTRYYPSALGRSLPQEIGKEFATILLAEAVPKPGKKIVRVLRTLPREELDLKIPSLSIPGELDIKDGLLHVFQALTPSSVALVSGSGSPVSEPTLASD